MLIWLLLLAATALGSNIELPLSKLDGQQHYLKLTVGGHTGLFSINFSESQSFIVKRLKSSGDRIEVKSQKTVLGKMTFAEIAGKHPDVDVIGIIGLSTNSSFMTMLEEQLKSTVGLSFDLRHSLIHVVKDKCESSLQPPYDISIGTWTNFTVSTPLSFNFHPPADFLALMNVSKQPFSLSSSRYNNLNLDVQFQQRRQTLKASNLLVCLKSESNRQHECSITTGNDVGLLLFSFPILICSKGLKILGRINHSLDYDSMFAGLLVLYIGTLLLLLNWDSIRAQVKEERLYIEVPFLDRSAEKLQLIQEILPG